MFCPKCGSLLRPKAVKGRKVLACSCGYSGKEKAQIIFKEEVKKDKEIEVVEKDVTGMPVVDAKCHKCGNDKAYFWTMQTRAGDEPETQFFRCTECKKTWRKYG